MSKATFSPEAKKKLEAAALMAHRDQLSEAISAYKEFLQMEPELVPAWNYLAYLLHKTGDLEKSQEAYERSLAINPNDVTALYRLALISIKIGESTKAEELLRRGIPLCKPSELKANMCVALSHILLMQKRFDEVKAFLLEATRSVPDGVGAYYNLAYLYCSQERWDDGLAVSIKLLSIQHNCSDAYSLIANTLSKMGKDKASQKLKKKVATLQAKEKAIEREWKKVIAETERELDLAPFRFDLFLPEAPATS